MDLGFGAHDTLSQRGWNGEESVRNLLGRQTAHLPQRQCYASFRRHYCDGIVVKRSPAFDREILTHIGVRGP